MEKGNQIISLDDSSSNGKIKRNKMASDSTANHLASHQNTTKNVDRNELKTFDHSSDDEDDTLSNILETDNDEDTTDEDVLLEQQLGGDDELSDVFKDNKKLLVPNSQNQNSEGGEALSNISPKESPVFYLEPSDWEKANLRKTMQNNQRSSSTPQSSNVQFENIPNLHNHLIAKKPNSCPRIPSPLSLSIPLNSSTGVRKPNVPQTRRLLSPQTVYTPLLSRMHQSESMQTLPECSSFDGNRNQTGERVRSFSSSSNPRSCHNIYRQSFGSGSFSGQVSPLARSESAFFASPVKRGSVVNESMGIPINNRGTSHNLKRPPATINHMRHRKTAIPLLCSRAAVMVSILYKCKVPE